MSSLSYGTPFGEKCKYEKTPEWLVPVFFHRESLFSS